MTRTIVLLDGHPKAFEPFATERDGKDQLPPVPVWAGMVAGTLEFCRIAWDLQQAIQADQISVMVANDAPFVLNDWHKADQTVEKVAENFPAAQPRNASKANRLQIALEKAFFSLMNEPNEKPFYCCRLVLLLLSKQADETLLTFRNNEDEHPKDLRIMIQNAVTSARKRTAYNKHFNVQVDILRLIPASNGQPLPSSHADIRINNEVTVSVRNIPNRHEDVKRAMVHIAQLYYDLGVLQISNIPMKVLKRLFKYQFSCTKSDNNQQVANTPTTQTVSLYYPIGIKLQHMLNKRAPRNDVPIHDIRYFEDRWCTCTHAVSPTSLVDAPTEAYMAMTLQGSVSYLMTPEVSQTATNNKVWTHMLMAHQGVIHLHCFDVSLESAFTRVKSENIEGVKIKLEDLYVPTVVGDTAETEFFETVVQPNSFSDLDAFLAAENNQLTTFDPLKFSHKPAIERLLEDKMRLVTRKPMEKATRWRTCFRDCAGTDLFTVTLNGDRSIPDYALDVLNGVPKNSGFGVTLRAKELLVALYLVGKRFKEDSDSHGVICSYILSEIENIATPKAKGADHDEATTSHEDNAVDMAWGQAMRYKNMTHREKEEIVRSDIAEGSKSQRPNRRPEGRGEINPNFRGRRSAPKVAEKPATYPDPSVMKPYLEFVPPTVTQKRRRETKEMGPEGSLVWLCRMADRSSKQGSREEGEDWDGKGLVVRDGKLKRNLNGQRPNFVKLADQMKDVTDKLIYDRMDDFNIIVVGIQSKSSFEVTMQA
ncbi:hypothetical protein DFQ30_005819 [Apophysomyces sp. BC1015]|nr:hypothetical protein DFQ30_005819 [Apophysomyces sp. BC1015]